MARKNLLAGLLDPADQTELTAVNSPRDDAAAARSERARPRPFPASPAAAQSAR